MRFIGALKQGALLAIALFLPLAANAESLESAMAYAYQNNPDINATRASVRASSETITQTRSGLLPQINLSAGLSQSGNDVSGNWVSSDAASATLSASLLVYDGSATQNGVRAAQSDTQAAILRLQSAEQQLLLNVAQSYIEVLRTQSLVTLNQRNVDNARTQTRTAQIRFDEGVSDASEKAQADAALAGAQADLISSQADLANAKATYAQLVGRQPTNLQAVGVPAGVPGTLDQAIGLAQTNSPLIKAAIETERAAQFRLRQAKGARLPSVNLSASGTISDDFDNDTDSVTSSSLGLNVALPLYSGGRITSLARQAEDLLVARSNETNSTRHLVDQAVTSAWSGMTTSSAALDALNAAVQAQQVALDSAQIQYDEGLIDLTTLLDRQQALLSAQVSARNTGSQQQLARYNLLYSVGTLGVETLGLGVAPINPLARPASTEVKSQGQETIDNLADRWSQ